MSSNYVFFLLWISNVHEKHHYIYCTIKLLQWEQSTRNEAIHEWPREDQNELIKCRFPIMFEAWKSEYIIWKQLIYVDVLIIPAMVPSLGLDVRRLCSLVLSLSWHPHWPWRGRTITWRTSYYGSVPGRPVLESSWQLTCLVQLHKFA